MRIPRVLLCGITQVFYGDPGRLSISPNSYSRFPPLSCCTRRHEPFTVFMDGFMIPAVLSFPIQRP